MKLGRVFIDLGYVVDLDNEEMVWQARDSLIEDVYNAIKYDELSMLVNEEERDDVDEDQIPEFLLEISDDWEISDELPEEENE